MLESGTELIKLTSELDYTPTFISTDRRQPAGAKTSLGYMQIGVLEQYGFARGPIFKIEVAYLNVTSTHIKVWGIDNVDDDGVIYPKTFFTNHPTLNVYLKKFAFCNSAGVIATESASNYTIVGYKKRSYPVSW
jgi:hypothetical protein